MRQSLKFKLLKFGVFNSESLDEAKEVIRIFSGKTKGLPCKTNVKDGVYVICKNGSYFPFSKETNIGKDVTVAAIGIIHDGHSFGVCLHDVNEDGIPLLKENNDRKISIVKYKEREVDAINDWNAAGNTKQIIKKGTDIKLNKGETIPSLGMLSAMCYYKELLYEALTAVGGDPLKAGWYWSSSELSGSYSWGLNFGNGSIGGGCYECGSNYVRPCTAFNL